jgi:hypothetical protein
MKLDIKSLLKDKNVLYVVLFIAVTNVFAYLMLRQFDAIVFFLIAGFLSSYFSKNMIIIMLVAILSTNFLIGTKLIGKKVKEGLENMKEEGDKKEATEDKEEAKEEEEEKKPTEPFMHKTCKDKQGKPIPCKIEKTKEKFSALSPASIHEGDEGTEHKVDYASTLESAYDNLDKLLGSDAIKTMTQDTQRLAEKQKLLMGNIKQLQPMMQTAGKMLDGLNVGQMGDMLTNLEDKFKKFTGGAKTA